MAMTVLLQSSPNLYHVFKFLTDRLSLIFIYVTPSLLQGCTLNQRHIYKHLPPILSPGKNPRDRNLILQLLMQHHLSLSLNDGYIGSVLDRKA